MDLDHIHPISVNKYHYIMLLYYVMLVLLYSLLVAQVNYLSMDKPAHIRAQVSRLLHRKRD